jgi:type IV secretory pathway VirB9-like protein
MKVLVLVAGLCLSACALQSPLPPAIPDPPHFGGWPDMTPGFATPDQLQRPPVRLLPDVAPAPVRAPTPVKPVSLPPIPERRVKPETVVADALRSSTVLPSKRFYWEGTSGILRYPYAVGKVWQVYSSPTRPTLIQIPPGLRLAAPPMLDPEEWEWQAMESGTGATRQESVLLRPLKAGVEAMMPLLTTGGLAFLCQLRALEKTSMVAVTWEIAPTLVVPDPEPAVKPVVSLGKSPPRKATESGPQIALERLHTAYTIEVVGKTKPPWGLVAVFDDGTRTYLKFREPLTFTDAPMVFAVNADRSPSLVELTTYTNPSSPQDGLYYTIQGLYPQLRLRGAESLEIKITRIPNAT